MKSIGFGFSLLCFMPVLSSFGYTTESNSKTEKTNVTLYYEETVEFDACIDLAPLDPKTFCLNCGVVITCDDPSNTNKATASSCPSQTACYLNECTPIQDAPGECRCEFGDGVFPMPSDYSMANLDETWYIDCIQGTPYYQKCTEGKVFNDDTNKCMECMSGTHYPELPHCTGFYTCIEQSIFLHKEEVYCADKQIFSTEMNKCINYDGSFQCYKTGIFSDPFDCRRYQQCAGTNGVSIGKCCEDNQVFNGVSCVADSGVVNCDINDECINNNINLLDFCSDSGTDPVTTCPGSCSSPRIPDPDNEHGYLECQLNGQGTYTTTPRSCPANWCYKDCLCSADNC